MGTKKKTRLCEHCRQRFVPSHAAHKRVKCPFCHQWTQKPRTLSQWDKEVDGLFGKLVRFVWEPNQPCCSCGQKLKSEHADCGHYMRREFRATRLMRENCHPQCKSCNGGFGRNFWSENINVHNDYRKWMVEKYGDERVCEIEALAHSGAKRPTVPEYRELAAQFRVELEHHGIIA